MHTIYHTRAVILKSTPAREADKLFWLFTRELGLVVALATGIRKPESKLRAQLIDYTFVDVDLVRGKEAWRLVSGSEVANPLRESGELARPYVRLLGALERFLVDEGEHPQLFAHVEEVAGLMREPLDPKLFDTLALWRALAHLGYISVDDESVFTLPFREALTRVNEEMRKRLVVEVNRAITQTHL